MGDLDGAIREYLQIIDFTPNDADTHNNLGAALAKKRYLDGAIRQFREALRLDPDNAMARRNLAVALETKK